VSTVAGVEVTTLEGIGSVEKPHPIQRAFIDEQAVQCGFCLSGVLTAKAYLIAIRRRTRRTSGTRVRRAVSMRRQHADAEAITRYARG
jgi:aerobic-type carbon monoxide dehydrogenase small subunit (CoxS/CutS family)